MRIIQIDEEVINLFRKVLRRHSKGEVCQELGYKRSSSTITKMIDGQTKTIYEWQKEKLIDIIKGD